MAAVTQVTGMNREQMLLALGNMRPVEFYMPVEGHRRKWHGDDAPMVAIALVEEEPPEAFDTQGGSRLLSREFPPSEPVLVMAAMESDFAGQIALNKRGLAERQCASAGLETLEEAGQRCARTGNVRHEAHLNMSDIQGLFLTEVRFTQNHCAGECWAWGRPEYEIHMFGRVTSAGAPKYMQCVGEKPWASHQPGSNSSDYTFDQDGVFWSGLSKLLSKSQYDSLAAIDTTVFMYMWEDDTDACRMSHQWASQGFERLLTGLVLPATALLGTGMCENEACLIAGLALAVLTARPLFDLVGDVLNGGDDPIGALVDRATFPQYHNAWNSGNNLLIVDPQSGNAYKGAATIQYAFNPSPGPITHVRVSMPASLMPIGYSLQLNAWPLDANDLVAANAGSPTWSSSNTSIATVDSTGLVSAWGLGSVTVTATIDGFSSNATIEVVNIGEPVEIRVAPSLVSLTTGQSGQLIARLYDSNGFEVPVQQDYEWSVDRTGVCEVDNLGLVTAVAAGADYAFVSASKDSLTSAQVGCSVNGGNESFATPRHRSPRRTPLTRSTITPQPRRHP